MKNTLETRLGLFFAFVLIAAAVLMEMIGGFEFFKRGTPVRARFNNIQELQVGDSVKMGGFRIGRVEGIHLVDNQIEVILKLDRKSRVKTDSKATIRFVGLMGQNYVAVDFGSPHAPLIKENAQLTTGEQPDMNQLLARLDTVASGVEKLTQSLGTDNLSNFMGPLTDFIKENKDKVSGILSNVQMVTAQIARGEGTVGRLIREDALYTSALDTVTNLNATVTDIRGIAGDARATLTQVNQGHGTLGRLIRDDTLIRETTDAAANLREILQKINRGTGTLGKLVNDEALINSARLTLQKLDKATEGLEDQGPLSVLGIAANSLF